MSKCKISGTPINFNTNLPNPEDINTYLAKPDKTIDEHHEEVKNAFNKIKETIDKKYHNIISTSCLLHDIGKTNTIFQDKIRSINEGNSSKITVYHSNKSKNDILKYDGKLKFLAQLVSGHHGIWNNHDEEYENKISPYKIKSSEIETSKLNKYIKSKLKQ